MTREQMEERWSELYLLNEARSRMLEEMRFVHNSPDADLFEQVLDIVEVTKARIKATDEEMQHLEMMLQAEPVTGEVDV